MSQTLVDELASARGYRRLHQMCVAGQYVVIPAFEVILDTTMTGKATREAHLEMGLRRARAIVRHTKMQLLKALPQGWLVPFGFWRKFTAGHGPTDFTRWAPGLAPPDLHEWIKSGFHKQQSHLTWPLHNLWGWQHVGSLPGHVAPYQHKSLDLLSYKSLCWTLCSSRPLSLS